MAAELLPGYEPHDTERWLPETHTNPRSDFARDRGRLLHSSALRRLAGTIKPRLDLDRVEAEEMAPLDEGDPTLVYEPADVPCLDTETMRDGFDVPQRGR